MPPLTLYQIHALVARLSPNTADMYEICNKLGPAGAAPAPTEARSVISFFSFAVCAAMYPKKRNMVVPRYSPIMATIWPLPASLSAAKTLFGLWPPARRSVGSSITGCLTMSGGFTSSPARCISM